MRTIAGRERSLAPPTTPRRSSFLNLASLACSSVHATLGIRPPMKRDGARLRLPGSHGPARRNGLRAFPDQMKSAPARIPSRPLAVDAPPHRVPSHLVVGRGCGPVPYDRKGSSAAWLTRGQQDTHLRQRAKTSRPLALRGPFPDASARLWAKIQAATAAVPSTCRALRDRCRS